MRFRLVEDAAAEKVAEQEIDALPKTQQDVVKQLRKYIDWEVIDNASEIENELDDSLRTAITNLKHGEDDTTSCNLLLVGQAGTGKTSIVKKWAQKRKINLVRKSAATMDKTDMGGAVAAMVDDEGKPLNKVTRLSNTEFDALDKFGSVLFLDELNRADPEITGSLLTLILNHEVPDTGVPDNMRQLQGYLFTVAAINPADEAYEGTFGLDTAMRTRYKRLNVGVDIPQYRRFLLGKLQDQLKIDEQAVAEDPDDEWNREDLLATQGKIKLAETILSYPLFSFDSIEEERDATRRDICVLTPRTLNALFASLKKGTKDEFIKKWTQYCNPDKLDMIEQILTDYVDVEDKANDALRYKDGFLPDEEEESIFSKEPNAWEILQGKLNK